MMMRKQVWIGPSKTLNGPVGVSEAVATRIEVATNSKQERFLIVEQAQSPQSTIDEAKATGTLDLVVLNWELAQELCNILLVEGE